MDNANNNLERKSQPLALITGGSSGLGLAMAKQLAESGYEIILIARNEERLNRAIVQIQALNQNVSGFSADIQNEQALKTVADYLEQSSKKIDFLILNAGIVRINTVMSSPINELKEVIDNDLWGTILSTKIFLPFVKKDAQARILFISSALGLLGAAGYSGYCAAKAGVINFAMTLRRELLGNIAVQVACPKDIDTPQYEEEKKLMPDWMSISAVRGGAMPPETAASKILRQSKKKKFLIITNFDLYFLLFILPRFIPQSLNLWLGDKLIPRP